MNISVGVKCRERFIWLSKRSVEKKCKQTRIKTSALFTRKFSFLVWLRVGSQFVVSSRTILVTYMIFELSRNSDI